MKNDFKKVKKENKSPRKRKEHKGDSKLARALRSILDGSILTRENVVRLIPFILFLTAICIIYIANSYYSIKTVRQSIEIRKELKEFENEYLSTKSELMMCSKQSELLLMLDSTGLIESLVPPTKIFVMKENDKAETP